MLRSIGTPNRADWVSQLKWRVFSFLGGLRYQNWDEQLWDEPIHHSNRESVFLPQLFVPLHSNYESHE